MNIDNDEEKKLYYYSNAHKSHSDQLENNDESEYINNNFNNNNNNKYKYIKKSRNTEKRCECGKRCKFDKCDECTKKHIDTHCKNNLFAYKTSSQSITITETDITFNTFPIMIGWTYSSVTNAFTCLINGLYSVTYTSVVSNSFTDNLDVLFRLTSSSNIPIPSSETWVTVIANNNSGYAIVNNTVLLYLDVGNTIKLRAIGSNNNGLYLPINDVNVPQSTTLIPTKIVITQII